MGLPALVALPRHPIPQTEAAPLVFALDPAQSSVHWTLVSSLHTVHGTFALKSGRLQVNPTTGKASGEIVVDAASGKSDNDGRDRKMHKEVLESSRYGEIVFKPDSLSGDLATQGDSTVQLHGVFLLHGGQHEVNIPVQANVTSGHWTGSAKFGVPFIEWGLKNPSTWLLKVDRTVSLELELRGTLRGPVTQ